MSSTHALFCHEARRFVAVVESFSTIPVNERAAEAASAIAALYAAALWLPEVEPTDFDLDALRVDRPTGVDFDPSYYHDVLDPYSGPDTAIGDLADDVLDIYQDIKRGLLAFEQGHEVDATWYWRLLFQAHWGRHAVGALGALHPLLLAHRRGESVRLEVPGPAQAGQRPRR